MKRKISLLFLGLGALVKINSQVLTENFTAPFTLNATSGWIAQNNSAPTSTLGWFQGNSVSTFSAYNGGVDDYYAANFNSSGANTAAGTISNWLISPVVTIVNGAAIQFATRTINTNTVFPDRLQVYFSTTSSVNIPTGPTSLGSFTNLVFDVNSTLSSTTTAVLNGTTTTGYPQQWTVYTTSVSGVTGSVSGRFAFRYFVTNAGPVGGNSNYIGLDAVKYIPPCDQPVITTSSSISSATLVCSGSTVGLSASSSGSSAATSYTWSSGANSATTVITPSASGIYTVLGTSSVGCVGSQTVAVTVTATPIISIPNYTVCASTPQTLTATGASSYTWQNSASTGSTLVISPSVTTVYTVTGTGSNTLCPATGMGTITVGSQLSMDVPANAYTICAGQTVTLSVASGASSLTWTPGGSSATFTASPATSTVYTVNGSLGSCTGSNSISVTVNSNPTFSVTQTESVCPGGTFSASATGANSYVFMFLSFSSTNNPVSYTASAANLSTTVQYSVIGSGTNGCTSQSINTYTINSRPIISIVPSKFIECTKSTVTLTASGASSYTWTGIGTATNAVLSFPTGSVIANYSFTASGVSPVTGCVGSSNITILISDCAGIESNSVAGNDFRAYPNPFTNELNIAGLEGHVEIFNLLGQSVINTFGNETGVIRTGELQNGIYILKAYNTSGKEIKSIKLIKN